MPEIRTDDGFPASGRLTYPQFQTGVQMSPTIVLPGRQEAGHSRRTRRRHGEDRPAMER